MKRRRDDVWMCWVPLIVLVGNWRVRKVQCQTVDQNLYLLVFGSGDSFGKIKIKNSLRRRTGKKKNPPNSG